jgi:hypothetical protein
MGSAKPDQALLDDVIRVAPSATRRKLVFHFENKFRLLYGCAMRLAAGSADFKAYADAWLPLGVLLTSNTLQQPFNSKLRTRFYNLEEDMESR